MDDGSGVVPCCQWRKTEDSDQGLVIPPLGQLVSVFGRVSEFRDERQIKVLFIGIHTYTMASFLYSYVAWE